MNNDAPGPDNGQFPHAASASGAQSAGEASRQTAFQLQSVTAAAPPAYPVVATRIARETVMPSPEHLTELLLLSQFSMPCPDHPESPVVYFQGGRWAVMHRDAVTIFQDVGDVCSPDLFKEERVVFLDSISPINRRRIVAHVKDPRACKSCGELYPDADDMNLVENRFCSLACKYLRQSTATITQAGATESILPMSYAPSAMIGSTLRTAATRSFFPNGPTAPRSALAGQRNSALDQGLGAAKQLRSGNYWQGTSQKVTAASTVRPNARVLQLPTTFPRLQDLSSQQPDASRFSAHEELDDFDMPLMVTLPQKQEDDINGVDLVPESAGAASKAAVGAGSGGRMKKATKFYSPKRARKIATVINGFHASQDIGHSAPSLIEGSAYAAYAPQENGVSTVKSEWNNISNLGFEDPTSLLITMRDPSAAAGVVAASAAQNHHDKNCIAPAQQPDLNDKEVLPPTHGMSQLRLVHPATKAHVYPVDPAVISMAEAEDRRVPTVVASEASQDALPVEVGDEIDEGANGVSVAVTGVTEEDSIPNKGKSLRRSSTRQDPSKELVLFEGECEICHQMHDGPYASGQFCSQFYAKRKPKERNERRPPLVVSTPKNAPTSRAGGEEANISQIPIPSPKRSRGDVVAQEFKQGIMRVKCGLCRSVPYRATAVLHPVLTQSSFLICRRCGDAIVARLREHTNFSVLGSTFDGPVRVSQVESDLDREKEQVYLEPRVTTHDKRGHPVPDSKLRDKDDGDGVGTRKATKEYRRLHAVVDEILYMTPPSDLAEKGLSMGIVRRLESSASRSATATVDLDVPIGMLSIMRLIFARVGACFKNGKLSWPLVGMNIPTEQDLCWMIETALPRSTTDRVKGMSGGARVWNLTFPERPWSPGKMRSRDIFGLVLGLVGILLVPPRRSSGRHKEVIHLDLVSISMTMHNAFDRTEDSDMQAIFDFPELVVPRALTRARQTEAEAKLFSDPRADNVGQCSCCGSVRDAKYFPFLLVPCKSCSKSFCTLCLCIAFGAGDYERGRRNMSYVCQPCRLSAKLLAVAEARGASGRVGQDPGSTGRRPQGRPNADDSQPCVGNEAPAGNASIHLPLIFVSQTVACSCLGLGKKDAANDSSRPNSVAFAVFCESLNESILSRTASESVCKEGPMCYHCKRSTSYSGGSGEGNKEDGQGESLSNAVTCVALNCDVVAHVTCANILESTSRDSWLCSRHTCCVCASPDAVYSEATASKSGHVPLAHCRTCLTAYCEPHLPDFKNIHVYGGDCISCPKCTPNLEEPKLSTSYIKALSFCSSDVGPTSTTVPCLVGRLKNELEKRTRRVDTYAGMLQSLVGGENVDVIQFGRSIRKKKMLSRYANR